MSTPTMVRVAAMLLALSILPTVGRADVTSEQVKHAVENAKRYLLSTQRADGRWPDYGRSGGVTALNALALLNAGMAESHPAIQKALASLDTAPNRDTYVVALKCMVYRYADPKKYHRQLNDAAQWLISAQLPNGTWTYNKMSDNLRVGGRAINYIGDNSNTQFALMGLHEAANGGVKVPQVVWQRSEKHFANSQLRDGSWNYRADINSAGRGMGYGSMTCAGIASLYITGQQLAVSDERGYENGAAPNCGHYRQNKAITAGLKWLTDNFSVDSNPGRGAAAWTLYYLYAMERVGMISGLKFFGPHDWYRKGAERLVRTQAADGSWAGLAGAATDTAFGLLFLAKGHKPVLINKLAWSGGDEWQPDRDDIENVIKFINSKAEGFSDDPLAWQTMSLSAPLVELMDAPILYFNGHTFPQFTAAEQAKLKEFVDQGGTIFAEACCSKAEFIDGFRKFARDAWPDYPLGRLDDGHPIFSAFYELKGNEWGLEGVQVGCRTSVIFAPKDLSCLWQQQTHALSETAFKIATNVAAYATGLERLKGKLERARIAERSDQGGQPGDIVRGALHIGVLAHDPNRVENMPDAGALPKFHEYLRDQAKIDVVSKLVIIQPDDPELLNHPIMYMTGHKGFAYSQGQIKALRKWLDRGGFLFADACCGRDNANYNLLGDRPLVNDFGTSFRKMVEEVYRDRPDVKLVELAADHPIRGGAAVKGLYHLDQVTYRPEIQKKLAAAAPANARNLRIEGVTVDGRLVIAYSRYAVTCGLEDHKCFNCRGLVSQDAYRLATNVILYALNN